MEVHEEREAAFDELVTIKKGILGGFSSYVQFSAGACTLSDNAFLSVDMGRTTLVEEVSLKEEAKMRVKKDGLEEISQVIVSVKMSYYGPTVNMKLLLIGTAVKRKYNYVYNLEDLV